MGCAKNTPLGDDHEPPGGAGTVHPIPGRSQGWGLCQWGSGVGTTWPGTTSGRAAAARAGVGRAGAGRARASAGAWMARASEPQ